MRQKEKSGTPSAAYEIPLRGEFKNLIDMRNGIPTKKERSKTCKILSQKHR